MSTRETLLELSATEKKERQKVEIDYYFYKGVCEDKEVAKRYKAYLGQNWESTDNVDYATEQDIRNKVKPLLKKQARFMFSKKPDIKLNTKDFDNKEELEKLRVWLDDLFSKAKFWKKSKEAFLNASIKKRVMLRLIAEEGNINFKYEDILDSSYEIAGNDLVVVRFIEEDKNNCLVEDSEKIYYIHEFSYKKIEDQELIKPFYIKKKYLETKLQSEEEKELDVNKIPCWLITNGGELGEEFGETDLEDLKIMQTVYNKTSTDVNEAIRFGLFGVETVIDADEDDVNKLNVCPGAIHAVKTHQQAMSTGKQASILRQEYSLNNISSVDLFLTRLETDMYNVLDMPRISDLTTIPSAKAMKYLYNDLIARCEEKWTDWGSVFEELIRYIIEIADIYKLKGFDKKWKDLDFSIEFVHNYPIPSDEEDRKTVAISEVVNNVRSIKDYIREFSSEDDYEKEFAEIVKEQSMLAGAEMSEFETIKTSSDIKNKEEEDDKKRDMDEE